MKWIFGLIVASGIASHQGLRPTSPPLANATCYVAVVDADGLPVTGLGITDFELTSDGQPVTLMSVTPAPADLSVILIVDATSSQPLRRYEINNAMANYWFPNLRPGDRVRIGTLGTPLTLSPLLPVDLSSALGFVRPLIERATAEPSPLWDATKVAIESLKGMAGAKLVVLLSDGRSTANRFGLDDVAESAFANDVAISSVSEGGERILLQAGEIAADRVRSDASLQWLADQTGGLFLADGVARRTMTVRKDPFAYVRELVQTPNQPGPLLAKILTAFRHRYRLTFAGPTDGRIHRLDVKVRVPKVSVSVKRRY